MASFVCVFVLQGQRHFQPGRCSVPSDMPSFKHDCVVPYLIQHSALNEYLCRFYGVFVLADSTEGNASSMSDPCRLPGMTDRPQMGGALDGLLGGDGLQSLILQIIPRHRVHLRAL